VIYSLTPKGIDLAPVLMEMVLWAATHEDTGNQALVPRNAKGQGRILECRAATLGRSEPSAEVALGHSDRSASVTSTRAARAAGNTDATTAAASSTTTDTITGRLPGIFTSSKELRARRTNTYPNAAPAMTPPVAINGAFCNDARQQLPRLRSDGQPDAEPRVSAR